MIKYCKEAIILEFFSMVISDQAIRSWREKEKGRERTGVRKTEEKESEAIKRK